MDPALIDLLIIGVLALAGLTGIRLGLARGLAGIACAAAIVTLILFLYVPLARWLERAADLPRPTATLSALAALAVLGQILCYVAIQWPLGMLLARLYRRPWPRRLDAALGVVPGVLLGFLVASLLLAPLAVALPGTGIGPAAREARIAPRLLEADALLLHRLRVRALLQPAVEALALTAPLPAATRTGDRALDLPFRVEQDDLAPDPDAEARLLALVNTEREAEGLPPLEPDADLVPVARAHGTEMFTLGYFAHESPNTGAPFDRITAAGIPFLAAGENLAYAPTVEVAHRGLMDSPGHRANILSPSFGRAGIGIIHSDAYGLMVVQLFRD